MIAFLTPFLLFIAFLLLLLVSLSAPIIHSIFLFRLSANISSSLLSTGANASANFGVWGYCLSSIQVAVAGIKKSTDARCSQAHLGYTFDSSVANILGAEKITNLISRTTTGALVLHPIAAALTFLTLLISLFMLRRRSNDTGTARLPSFLTFGVGFLAATLTTVVFLIDVIFVAVIRKRVRDATDDDLNLTWGNAVWLTLTAAVLLWISMIGACCGIFASRRAKRIDNRY